MQWLRCHASGWKVENSNPRTTTEPQVMKFFTSRVLSTGFGLNSKSIKWLGYRKEKVLINVFSLFIGQRYCIETLLDIKSRILYLAIQTPKCQLEPKRRSATLEMKVNVQSRDDSDISIHRNAPVPTFNTGGECVTLSSHLLTAWGVHCDKKNNKNVDASWVKTDICCSWSSTPTESLIFFPASPLHPS